MKNQRRMHAAADRIEGRVAAAVERSFETARGRVDVLALMMALQSGSVRAASAVVQRADLEDALAPAGKILEDALVKGGAIGAEEEE